MNQNIYQLAYLSERKQDVSDEDIVDGIVLPALTKNRSLGVTGCIWFDPGHFFQVLEGPLETIESLFAVIAADDRHACVDRILTDDTKGVRRFDRFGMRAVHSEAARSMPDFIAAYNNALKPIPVKPSRWRDRAARARPASSTRGQDRHSLGELTRSVIHQLADWSEATPA